MMASSVLNQCACSCTDAFRGPESADAFSDDEGPCGYGGGGQLSPGGKHFFDGHEHLAVVESASRVAIHAFFREHKPSKPSAEIDAMIERYERKRVSPRVLLHLVEGAFTRGRIKKRQSVIYQRRSVLAQRLRLEQGPSTPTKFHGLAATPGIFADGAPPPPPQHTPTLPAPPPPSPASETRELGIRAAERDVVESVVREERKIARGLRKEERPITHRDDDDDDDETRREEAAAAVETRRPIAEARREKP
ncbi:hypothetical protein JL721_4219 [Aureococcus anophagefferens]|nr:hypothetical protein JL721_4219 [Aureococcus anophagefferens]